MTIVTHQRDLLFGKIVDGNVRLNEFGKIADECWCAIPEHFPNVDLGAHVVMPNHAHGIIVIRDDHRTATFSSLQKMTPHSLGVIVGSFKSAVTRRIGRELNATGIWQRNYYEHIIRNEKDLRNKTDYIEANPILWEEDEDNPRNHV